MHVQLAHVSSDLSGVPGWAILRALLAGARDPAKLAACNDDRINASPPTLAQRLEGTWRDEGLFNLRQSLELDAVYQQHIAACDARIAAHRHTFDRQIEVLPNPAPSSTRRPQNARRHEPHVDLHTQLYRIRGGDLTRLDGIEVLTAQPLIAEIGLARSRWHTATHVASWLGLCPDHRISGGNVLTRGPRDVGNRATDALRLAAQTLLPSQSALGANYRRLRARLGAPNAITAMAHKLARVVYRMLNYGQQ